MRDFWYWYGESVVLVLVCIAIAVVYIFGFVKLSESTCIAKTENMGFDNHWSWFGGCQIEVVEGQWIPLDSYYFKQE